MSDIYVHISAGDGPEECQWVVVQLANAYQKEAKANGLTAEIIWEGGVVKLAPSLLLKISDSTGNSDIEAFCAPRLGTVRWIGQSPIRKHNKRRNWYVGVTITPEIAEVPGLEERDIRYQAIRASGPGGQHVNKTSSAVRATHLPTGISVTAQEERSQFVNKRLTRIKLAMIFEAKGEQAAQTGKRNVWKANKSLERGNEVRVYAGADFKVKL